MLITTLWGFMITNQDDLALCWSLSRKYLVLWKAGLLKCCLQITKNYMIWARLALSCFHVSVLNCCCEWFVLAFCFVLVSNIIIWCHIKLGFLKQIKNIYVQWCPGRNHLARVVCNQNVQNTWGSDHFLTLRWRLDVEQVHVVVARSTLSQKC